MRGEFIRGSGAVLPNNISKAGAQMILAAAFRNTVPTLYAGLVTGIPSLTMTSADLSEPVIGSFGYTRISIPRNTTGWVTEGELGGERFLETDWLIWAAVAGNFSQPIQRVAILGTSAYHAIDPIYALSVPLPSPLVITPTTPLADRQFKYRIYL